MLAARLNTSQRPATEGTKRPSNLADKPQQAPIRPRNQTQIRKLQNESAEKKKCE